MEIFLTEETDSSHEQGRTSGTGASCQRSPSRENSSPTVSHDTFPLGNKRQAQRGNSDSEGVDRIGHREEYEKLQRRYEELKIKLETAQLQIQEGQRGRVRLTEEMETLRRDALQKEFDVVIRTMELLAEQDTTCAPSVALSATYSPPSNDAKSPEVREREIHPGNPPPRPSASEQQVRSGRHQYQSSLSRPSRNVYPTYDEDSLSLLDMGRTTPNRLLEPYANGSASPMRDVSGGPNARRPNTRIETSYYLETSNHFPPYGRAPYVHSEAQYPHFNQRIDVHNHAQLPDGYAGSSFQQGPPRSLLVGPRPSAELYLPRHNLNQPPVTQFSHSGGRGYTHGEFEYAYDGPMAQVHDGARFNSHQPHWPQTQRPSVERDSYFCGGFNPQLFQRR